jgi:hypothetical protein
MSWLFPNPSQCQRNDERDQNGDERDQRSDRPSRLVSTLPLGGSYDHPGRGLEAAGDGITHFYPPTVTEVSGHSGKLIARYNKLLATLWHSCTAQASATRLLAKLKFERSTSG